MLCPALDEVNLAIVRCFVHGRPATGTQHDTKWLGLREAAKRGHDGCYRVRCFVHGRPATGTQHDTKWLGLKEAAKRGHDGCYRVRCFVHGRPATGTQHDTKWLGLREAAKRGHDGCYRVRCFVHGRPATGTQHDTKWLGLREAAKRGHSCARAANSRANRAARPAFACPSTTLRIPQRAQTSASRVSFGGQARLPTRSPENTRRGAIGARRDKFRRALHRSGELQIPRPIIPASR